MKTNMLMKAFIQKCIWQRALYRNWFCHWWWWQGLETPPPSTFITAFIQVNSLRPRQNVRHFPDDIFNCIFLNENVWISSKITLKFVPKGRSNNIPALVQIMAWRRPGDKPLFEQMIVSFLTHICVTRPQWVLKWSILNFPSGDDSPRNPSISIKKSDSKRQNNPNHQHISTKLSWKCRRSFIRRI